MRGLNGKNLLIWIGGVVFAFTAGGCDCPENEYDAVDTCDQISAVVNEVLRQGGRPEQDRNLICGLVCRDASSCSPKTDVEACVAVIKAMPAPDVEVFIYRQRSECDSSFVEMTNSCASSDSSSDFDD